MAKSDRGWHAEAEIDIAAPPERVWAIVSDISRHSALAGSGEVLAVRMNGPLAVGTTFDSDVRTGEVESFSPRCVIETLDDRRRLGWLSLFPLDEGETEDHQIGVHWTFGLEPTPSGIRLAHTVHIPRPKLGADELASFFERTDRITTVRAGMERTVENIKAACEPLRLARRARCGAILQAALSFPRVHFGSLADDHVPVLGPVRGFGREARHMREEIYTLGAWRVRDGKQGEFVEAWRALGGYFRSLPQPAGEGTLLQSVDDPQQFYSFGPWRTIDDVQAMRSRPETAGEVGKLMDLCEEGRPGTFRIVATA